MSITHPTGAPTAIDYVAQHQLLDRCVSGDWRDDSLAALRRYFREDGSVEALYSGRRFERLAGGGDAPAVRDTMTPADVLALSFLSISKRLPAVTIDVTETYAQQIAHLLARVPTDLPMHQAPWEHYADKSPAAELWALLCRCGGKHRSVTANKLLAASARTYCRSTTTKWRKCSVGRETLGPACGRGSILTPAVRKL